MDWIYIPNLLGKICRFFQKIEFTSHISGGHLKHLYVKSVYVFMKGREENSFDWRAPSSIQTKKCKTLDKLQSLKRTESTFEEKVSHWPCPS